MYEMNLEKINILIALQHLESVAPLPTRYIVFIKRQLEVILNESIEASKLSPYEYINYIMTKE